ncbi:MAG: DUF4288 domain-containing protein [Ktedonobacteraceae bacterium]
MEIGEQKNLATFYIAIILYEASSDAPDYTPLYQESFVLLQAHSAEEARQKAFLHAQHEQISYPNEYNEQISWSFKQIIDVSPVLSETFNDGSELYARHFRDYQAYRLFEPLLSGNISSA